MLRPSPIRRPICFAALGIVAAHATRAHAALLAEAPDCSAAGNSLGCRLTSVLSFLYVAASLLAFVLLLVIVLAVRSFRRRGDNDKERP